MFEKEVDEIAVANAKKRYGLEDSVFMNTQECAYVHGFQDGADFGYKEGIGRLRYCCTCKHWTRCGDGNMYGICADWEIREEE